MPFTKSLLVSAIAILLVACASMPAASQESPATVAVWNFDDLSPLGPVQPNLGEIFAGEFIGVLQKKGNFTVVERERLLLALEELHLGTSALVDEATRLKLGKMVGARLMVFGAFQTVGDTMRLDLRMVEVETGRLKKAVEKTERSSDLQKQLDAVRKAAEEF